MTIEEVHPGDVTDAVLRELHGILCVLEHERLPDDPPPSFDVFQTGFCSAHPMMANRHWLIRSAGGVAIGRIDYSTLRSEENQHLVQLRIGILPEHRGQGIAKRALPMLIDLARGESRTVIMARTYSTVPSGFAFMKQLGAEASLTEECVQVCIADIPSALLEKHLSNTPNGYKLQIWRNVYPECHLNDAVTLHGLVNEVPRGSLDVSDLTTSPEQLRDEEAAYALRGIKRWTFAVEHVASGAFVGFSEVFQSAGKPHVLQQGITAIGKDHRGHGLGWWVKLAA
ncbi:MAG: GNAT family N-acetyltransferase, partial [Armatimonadaceae bacterium]